MTGRAQEVSVNAFRTKLVPSLLVVLAISSFVSCGGKDSPDSNKTALVEREDVSSGEIGPDDSIPMPKDKSVLSITGLISNPNDGEMTRLDLATLGEMPIVQLRVFEPFEKRNVTFEGVLMSDLMEIVGAEASATEVHFTALDHYKVDLSLKEIDSKEILLALKSDGKGMSVVDGGPTRIIFPPNSVSGRNSDMWIWNVKSMLVH
jgi:hypothetical protein